MKNFLGDHLKIEERKFFHSLVFPLFVIFILLVVKLVESLEGISLVRFGLKPLQIERIWTIATAPFIHGNLDHLLGNCTSFLVLGSSLFYFYSKGAYRIFFTIWILAGLGLWIIGRNSYHIGLSGIIYGLILFLILGSIIRGNKALGAVSFLVVLFYGSFIWGILPLDANLPYSWEAHLAGSLAGVIASIFFRNVSPSGLIVEPRYSFDDEDDSEVDESDRYWEVPLDKLEDERDERSESIN